MKSGRERENDLTRTEREECTKELKERAREGKTVWRVLFLSAHKFQLNEFLSVILCSDKFSSPIKTIYKKHEHFTLQQKEVNL